MALHRCGLCDGSGTVAVQGGGSVDPYGETVRAECFQCGGTGTVRLCANGCDAARATPQHDVCADCLRHTDPLLPTGGPV